MHLNAVNILKQTCDELYGKGTAEVRARNTAIEDLNKLSNFDPTTVTPDSEINYNLEYYNSVWSYRFVEGSSTPQYMNTKDVLGWIDIDSSRGIYQIQSLGETTYNKDNTGRIIRAIGTIIIYNHTWIKKH